jgi:hypothetical protein
MGLLGHGGVDQTETNRRFGRRGEYLRGAREQPPLFEGLQLDPQGPITGLTRHTGEPLAVSTGTLARDPL